MPSLWHNKTFVKLFTAYGLSTFGDWMDSIAVLTLFAYAWDSNPVLIALLPLAYAVPGILFGQAAGVLADRWKKLNLMMLADLASALLTALLTFAPSPYWALPLLALRSAAGVFNLPAQQALTRQVVSADHLLQATSMNGLVNQASKVIGPLAGGLLAAISPQFCLLVNAASFLVSALILFTQRSIKENESSASVQDNAPAFRDSWREGWQIVFRSRVLLASLFYGLIAFVLIQLIDYQFPVRIREIASLAPQWIGWVLSSIGAGSVATFLLLSRMRDIRSYGWYFGGGCLLLGLGIAYFGWMAERHLPYALLVAFCFGIGNGLVLFLLNYLTQKETPPDAVGRVNGILNSLSSLVWILAPLTGGVLVEQFGAAAAFLAIGAVLVVLGIVGVLFQRSIWAAQRV